MSATPEIRLLGRLEVLSAGRPVDIGGRLPRSIVAALALSANEVVSADQLADAVWGGAPPPTAVRTLQAYAARLRKALGADAGCLVSTKAGYMLSIDADAIDAARFEALGARGRAALAANEFVVARTECHEALGLWRGPALVEFAYADFAQGAILRLEELRLGVLEDRIEADLHLNPTGGALAELEELVERHPYRERLRGLLMRALHWAGRSPEALSVYHAGRRLLVDELGVEPGADLRELEGAILRDEPQVARPAPAITASLGNLPRSISSFVGRQNEAAELERALHDHRVVTIVGTGGAGKTRLGVHVAAHRGEHLPGGAWFVDLAPLTQPELVGHAVAKVLGVQDEPGTAIEETITSALASRECLILLDNCEQVVGAVRTLVARVAAGAPGVQILATSRQPLGLGGELVWPIPALPVPDPGRDLSLAKALEFDAVTLFVDRATSAAPHLAFDDADVGPVLAICRRLDGLPLAIELAAARLRTLSATEIEARLDDCFALLGTAEPDRAERHDSLESVVRWSFDLLTDDEQLLFARLGVFSGSFTLAAAEAVCADDRLPVDNVAGLISWLADKSLVTRAEVVDGASRYRLLEPMRIFARRRLAATGGDDALVRRRHAAYFVEQADVLGAAVRGPRWSEAVAVLHRETGDHRDALEWLLSDDDSDGAVRLAASLWPYWLRVSPTGEAASWIERARRAGTTTPDHRIRLLVAAAGAAFAADDLGAVLAATEEGLELAAACEQRPSPSQPYLLSTRALTLRLLNRPDEARAAADEAAGLAEATDDDWAKADAARVRALLARDDGDLPSAADHGWRAVELWDRCGNLPEAAGARSILGVIAADEGKLEEADLLYQTSLRGFRAAGDPIGEAHVLWRLADVALERAEPAVAVEHATGARDLARQLGDRRGVGQAETVAAEALLAMGRLAEAEEAATRALDHLSVVGFHADLCRVFQVGARLALALDMPTAAAEWVERAIAAPGTPQQQADTHCLLALTRAAQGDLEAAQAAADEAGELARATSYHAGLVRSLDCQALIAAAQGEDVRADVLRRAAITVMTRVADPLTRAVIVAERSPAPLDVTLSDSRR